MDFHFNDEQLAIKNLARTFSQEELAPNTARWDTEEFFPQDTLRKAARLGFAALYVNHAVQGTKLSRLDAALIFEELASGCISTTAYLTVHNMVAKLIDIYGNNSQREQWLPKLASMEYFASYCLTEANAGSDAAALQTNAKREGDYYLLNGSKAFVSGGSVSDVYACMVRTNNNGAHGITCLLVEKNTLGLSFGKPENKLGWRSQPTTQVFFDNCRVPIQNQIGQEGEGFKIALNALNGGRINIAACSLGGAQSCLTQARNYMLTRKQFDQRLADIEALQFKIADMTTELEAARLLTYRAAQALDQQDPNAVMYCAMAKRFATDTGFAIANETLQIFGGYGYLKDYPIEQYFRDMRVHQILEGTNEIMRLIIAKQIFSEGFAVF